MMLFAGMFYACSDSGPGTENNGSAPNIPAFIESISVDISYFTDNAPNIERNVAQASTGNFYQAKAYASSSSLYIFALGYTSAIITGIQSISDPEFKNGKWVWIYSYSVENSSISYKLTSNENGSDGYDWNFYTSFKGGDTNIDNALSISGTTSADGKTGTWKFYDIYGDNPSENFITSSYAIEAENKKTVSVEFSNFDSEGSNLTSDYTQNVDVFEIVYSSTQGENFTLHWNTTTQSGYFIDSESVKHCWDSSFQDVQCS